MYMLHKVASLLTRFRRPSINAVSAWLRKGIAHLIMGSFLMEYVLSLATAVG